MDKVCVTGGLGFIGKALIDHLKKMDSHLQILCIDDRSKLPVGYEHEFMDYNEMLEKNAFMDLSEVDFIFHLGANSSTRANEKELFSTSASIYGARRNGDSIAPQTH